MTMPGSLASPEGVGRGFAQTGKALVPGKFQKIADR
jgi:hypothetical protein